MDYKELTQNMARLQELASQIELAKETGAEAFDQAELEEYEILKELVSSEGADVLGRWLKSKEDEVAALKAEKDAITRSIARSNETIDFIKSKLYTIMTLAGCDKIKGLHGYSFTPYLKENTVVDKDYLRENVYPDVIQLLRETGTISDDMDVEVKASVSKVQGELPCYYVKTSQPSCKFIKPRAIKEE